MFQIGSSGPCSREQWDMAHCSLGVAGPHLHRPHDTTNVAAIYLSMRSEIPCSHQSMSYQPAIVVLCSLRIAITNEAEESEIPIVKKNLLTRF